MNPIRLLWMTCLVLSGTALVWLLVRGRAFDPKDKKAALICLFLGLAGVFAAGWFLFPPPEEASTEAPPLPPA
jgi:hypothetical protein